MLSVLDAVDSAARRDATLFGEAADEDEDHVAQMDGMDLDCTSASSVDMGMDDAFDAHSQAQSQARARAQVDGEVDGAPGGRGDGAHARRAALRRAVSDATTTTTLTTTSMSASASVSTNDDDDDCVDELGLGMPRVGDCGKNDAYPHADADADDDTDTREAATAAQTKRDREGQPRSNSSHQLRHRSRSRPMVKSKSDKDMGATSNRTSRSSSSHHRRSSRRERSGSVVTAISVGSSAPSVGGDRASRRGKQRSKSLSAPAQPQPQPKSASSSRSRSRSQSGAKQRGRSRPKSRSDLRQHRKERRQRSGGSDDDDHGSDSERDTTDGPSHQQLSQPHSTPADSPVRMNARRSRSTSLSPCASAGASTSSAYSARQNGQKTAETVRERPRGHSQHRGKGRERSTSTGTYDSTTNSRPRRKVRDSTLAATATTAASEHPFRRRSKSVEEMTTESEQSSRFRRDEITRAETTKSHHGRSIHSRSRSRSCSRSRSKSRDRTTSRDVDATSKGVAKPKSSSSVMSSASTMTPLSTAALTLRRGRRKTEAELNHQRRQNESRLRKNIIDGSLHKFAANADSGASARSQIAHEVGLDLGSAKSFGESSDDDQLGSVDTNSSFSAAAIVNSNSNSNSITPTVSNRASRKIRRKRVEVSRGDADAADEDGTTLESDPSVISSTSLPEKSRRRRSRVAEIGDPTTATSGDGNKQGAGSHSQHRTSSPMSASTLSSKSKSGHQQRKHSRRSHRSSSTKSRIERLGDELDRLSDHQLEHLQTKKKKGNTSTSKSKGKTKSRSSSSSSTASQHDQNDAGDTGGVLDEAIPSRHRRSRSTSASSLSASDARERGSSLASPANGERVARDIHAADQDDNDNDNDTSSTAQMNDSSFSTANTLSSNPHLYSRPYQPRTIATRRASLASTSTMSTGASQRSITTKEPSTSSIATSTTTFTAKEQEVCDSRGGDTKPPVVESTPERTKPVVTAKTKKKGSLHKISKMFRGGKKKQKQKKNHESGATKQRASLSEAESIDSAGIETVMNDDAASVSRSYVAESIAHAVANDHPEEDHPEPNATDDEDDETMRKNHRCKRHGNFDSNTTRCGGHGAVDDDAVAHVREYDDGNDLSESSMSILEAPDTKTHAQEYEDMMSSQASLDPDLLKTNKAKRRSSIASIDELYLEAGHDTCSSSSEDLLPLGTSQDLQPTRNENDVRVGSSAKMNVSANSLSVDDLIDMKIGKENDKIDSHHASSSSRPMRRSSSILKSTKSPGKKYRKGGNQLSAGSDSDHSSQDGSYSTLERHVSWDESTPMLTADEVIQFDPSNVDQLLENASAILVLDSDDGDTDQSDHDQEEEDEENAREGQSQFDRERPRSRGLHARHLVTAARQSTETTAVSASSYDDAVAAEMNAPPTASDGDGGQDTSEGSMPDLASIDDGSLLLVSSDHNLTASLSKEEAASELPSRQMVHCASSDSEPLREGIVGNAISSPNEEKYYSESRTGASPIGTPMIGMMAGRKIRLISDKATATVSPGVARAESKKRRLQPSETKTEARLKHPAPSSPGSSAGKSRRNRTSSRQAEESGVETDGQKRISASSTPTSRRDATSRTIGSNNTSSSSFDTSGSSKSRSNISRAPKTPSLRTPKQRLPDRSSTDASRATPVSPSPSTARTSHAESAGSSPKHKRSTSSPRSPRDSQSAATKVRRSTSTNRRSHGGRGRSRSRSRSRSGRQAHAQENTDSSRTRSRSSSRSRKIPAAEKLVDQPPKLTTDQPAERPGRRKIKFLPKSRRASTLDQDSQSCGEPTEEKMKQRSDDTKSLVSSTSSQRRKSYLNKRTGTKSDRASTSSRKQAINSKLSQFLDLIEDDDDADADADADDDDGINEGAQRNADAQSLSGSISRRKSASKHASNEAISKAGQPKADGGRRRSKLGRRLPRSGSEFFDGRGKLAGDGENDTDGVSVISMPTLER